MAYSKYLLTSLILLSFSCSKKVNQYLKTGKNMQIRNGRWIEKDNDSFGTYISKGMYTKGEKTGLWKTSYQGKKYHREKFHKGFSVVEFYYPNGKLMEKGTTETKILPQERIWQKTGDWNYYDEKGKILFTKRYQDGKKVDSISFKPSKK